MKKTVIVTGGNRGIGRDIVSCFVNVGYNAVVGARQHLDVESIAPGAVKFVLTDVRDPEAHTKLVEEAKSTFGSVDCYVNNAGYSAWKPIGEIDHAFLSDILETNLMGAFWGCKAAAVVMPAGSAIVNVSSIAGKRGSANNAAYVASKFGMNGLTQSLAKELGPNEIRVNAVCPVLVRTDGLLEALDQPWAPGEGDPDAFLNNFKKANTASNRLPTGVEVGNMCVFLASPQASAITGQCINVDCGVLPQ